MKNYFKTAVLLGAMSVVSCNENSKEAAREVEKIKATLELPSTSSQSGEVRKVWPPVSDKSASNPMIENYLVVLDDSGSMAGTKMREAKDALRQLADTLPDEHNLGLMMLNSKSEVPLDVGNRDAFKEAVNNSHARGGTPLNKSTSRAFQNITSQASSQQGYGNYHIIIVTDGESSDGSPMKLVKRVVEKTAVQFHVVGFHVNNHGMNNSKYVDYRTAKNSSELAQAFEAVAAETNEFSDPKEFSK